MRRVALEVINPACLTPRDFTSHKTPSPVGGKSINGDEGSANGVFIMMFQIVSRDTMLWKPLPDIGHMLIDSYIHSPNGPADVL